MKSTATFSFKVLFILFFTIIFFLLIPAGGELSAQSTCPPPSNIKLDSINYDAATLSWTANSTASNFSIRYLPCGGSFSTANRVFSNSTSITLTNLVPNLCYDFYVRGDCANGSSSWLGPFSFTPTYTVPYFQDFDATAPILGGTINYEDWSNTNSVAMPYWAIYSSTPSNNTGPQADHTSGNGSFAFLECSGGSQGDSDTLVSPTFSIDSNLRYFKLEFWYHMHGSNMGDLEVWADTNGGMNLITSYSGQQQNLQSDPWKLFSTQLGGYQGKSIRFKIVGLRGNGWQSDASIDDFSLDFSAALDAGISEVLVPGRNLCAGTYAPVVEVKNYGQQQINQLKVFWSVNGSQDSLTYSGLIDPDSTATLSLGNASFSSGNIYDLKFYTGEINNQADQFNINDSIILDSMRVGLNGQFTLDPNLSPSATNFTSFTNFEQTLNTLGICGNVGLTVAPGVYNTSLYLSEIKGAGPGSRLTIDGGDSSQTTLIHDGTVNFATVTFDGADYVTIMNMRIEAADSSGAPTILFTGGTDHNVISNNVLKVNTQSTNSSATNIALSAFPTAVTSYSLQEINSLTIEKNRIIGGYYGIRLSAPNSLSSSIGVRILDNEIDSVYYFGISASLQDSMLVNGNSIDLTNRSNPNSYGVFIVSTGSVELNSNRVNSNNIGVFLINSNAGRPRLLKCRLVNNMFSSSQGHALEISSMDSLSIWHNSLSSGSTNLAALKFNQSSNPLVDVIDLRNNVISGAGGPVLELESAISANSFDFIDHNIYYNSGSGPLIEFGGTTFTGLNSFQTAYPNFDQSSFEGNPFFVSNLDLHRIGALGDNSGDSTLGITIDIDGDPRPAGTSSAPDIGADEYVPANCLPPSNVNIDSIGLSSVSVSWTGNGTFEYLLTNQGLPPTSFPNQTTQNSFTFSGLSSASTYDIYIRALCPPSDTSFWLGPITITTATAIPYFEDFETFQAGISSGSWPKGWTSDQGLPEWRSEDASGTNENSINTGPYYDHTLINQSGGIYLYLESSGGNTDPSEMRSPPIYLNSSQSNVKLSYWYHMYGFGMGSLKVYVESNGQRTLLSTISGQQQPSGAAQWIKDSVFISGYQSSIITLVFEGTKSSNITSTSDMAIDDVELSLPPAIDGGVSRIISPTSDCSLGNDSVVVMIKNYGASSFSNFSLQYILNGGGPVVETFNGSIQPGDSAIYTFANTVNLSNSGSYSLVASTSISTDANNFNDTSFSTIDNIQLINLASVIYYSENFENGPAGWTSGGTNPTFVLDSPAGSIINQAASGHKAWVSNSIGDYSNNADEWVMSPCFDFTGVIFPVIEVSIWYELQSYFDGVIFEASTDGGINWSRIGITGDSINWYNDTALAVASSTINSMGDSWTGDGSNSLSGSNGWLEAFHDLYGFAGQPNVRFRFRLLSGGFGRNEGFAFDSVRIYSLPVGLDQPVGENISFQLSPNPSNGVMDLLIGNTQTNRYQMRVFNATGRLVHEERMIIQGNQRRQIDLRKLSKGVYFLQLQNENASKVEKLIIQ